jgi:hypothetical protein
MRLASSTSASNRSVLNTNTESLTRAEQIGTHGHKESRDGGRTRVQHEQTRIADIEIELQECLAMKYSAVLLKLALGHPHPLESFERGENRATKQRKRNQHSSSTHRLDNVTNSKILPN